MTDTYTIGEADRRTVLKAFATWAGTAEPPVEVHTRQPERYQAHFGTGVWLDDRAPGEWSDEDYGRVELKVPADAETAVLYANFKGYGDPSDATGENDRGISREIDQLEVGPHIAGSLEGREVMRVEPDLDIALDVGTVRINTA